MADTHAQIGRKRDWDHQEKKKTGSARRKENPIPTAAVHDRRSRRTQRAGFPRVNAGETQVYVTVAQTIRSGIRKTKIKGNEVEDSLVLDRTRNSIVVAKKEGKYKKEAEGGNGKGY